MRLRKKELSPNNRRVTQVPASGHESPAGRRTKSASADFHALRISEINAKKENHMNNLRKPIFWIYVILFIFVFFWLLGWIITSPSSLTVKVVLGSLGVLFCAVYATLIRTFLLRPIEKTGFQSLLGFISGSFVVLGFAFMFFGGIAIFSQLSSPPITYMYAWQTWGNIVSIAFFPFGFLIFILSIFSLISIRNPKKSANASAPDHQTTTD